jgi:TonB family protein
MRMALRALLFSSDGTSTSTLCQVLSELGIEAEICPEMLVAVEQISRQNYDAILVDWDQEVDAISLLKTVREQKVANQALSLAVVKNGKDLPRALQYGANSVIRKPIDPRQAKETLSTARDLILSRRSEQKTKEARTAAAQAAMAAEAAALQDEVESPAPKRGFVAQTAPRSAMEAVESTENQKSLSKLPQRQVEQSPAKLQEPEFDPQGPQPVNRNRWDQKPQLQESHNVEVAPRETRHSDDCTGVFSSLPEEEPQPEPEKQSYPRYLVFAVIGCFLIAAVLWVWAPGGSYQGLLSTVQHSLSRAPKPAASQPATTASPVHALSLEQPGPPSAPAPSAPEEQPGPTDPGPVESAEVDPSQLEVIETKAIPKPGAQKPAQTETPAGVDQEPAQTPATPTDVNRPTVQTPPPQVQPTVVPVAKPQTAVAVAAQPAPAPAGRTGVIIPDSLRTTPSQSPANSLGSDVVPEETSRNLVEHRVEPNYPAQALSQRLEGPVVLQVWVAKDGTVRDVKLVRGYFALARAASDAVRQWRFKPYSSNGKPVDFETIVTVNFKYPG